MGFKYYEQNQLMIPMEWKTLIDKNDVVFVLNDLIDNMNIDKLLETYSPLGNSSYSPKMMLKILMYGYIRKRYSSRQIAEAVQCDIKFIWLAGGNKPTRNVINSFRKDKMKIIMEDVFVELLVVLEKKGYINTEEYFVDGTKIEANANKYTFVWKKANFLSFTQSYTHYPQKKEEKTLSNFAFSRTCVLCTTDSLSLFPAPFSFFLPSDTIFQPLIIQSYNFKLSDNFPFIKARTRKYKCRLPGLIKNSSYR